MGAPSSDERVDFANYDCAPRDDALRQLHMQASWAPTSTARRG